MLISTLQTLARPGRRQQQDYRFIESAALAAWAAKCRLSLHQAYLQVLEEGIFPEALERNFPTLSAREQLQLFRSRALVAGLGGLGGQQAVLLARLGLGRLLLADGDCFTASNLNRQLLALSDNLGEPKVKITAEFLHRMNPALKVELRAAYLDGAGWAGLLAEVDVVLDGLDTLGARRELLAAARREGRPVVHGAVLGRDGQLTTVLPADPLTFEARYLTPGRMEPELPSVVAPIVAVVAGLQVQEAVRLLLHRPLAYHGRLAFLDGDTGELQFFPLDEPAVSSPGRRAPAT